LAKSQTNKCKRDIQRRITQLIGVGAVTGIRDRVKSRTWPQLLPVDQPKGDKRAIQTEKKNNKIYIQK